MRSGFAVLVFSYSVSSLPEDVYVVLVDFLPVDKHEGGRYSALPEVKSGEAQKGSVFVSLLRAEAVTLKGSAWST